MSAAIGASSAREETAAAEAEAAPDGGSPAGGEGGRAGESAAAAPDAAPAAKEADPPAAPATETGAAAPSRGSFAASARDRLARAGHFLRDHYCTIDPRTLGVFRLVLGFVLTADTLRHWKEARWFYSNEGVLTNHYHLFRPSSGHNFSLFHAFSSLGEVHVAFALMLFCSICYWIGWRTRLFAILCFVFVTSLDNRLVMVENGGYVVVNLLVGWTAFMPTGRRFSVDALLWSLRERRERTAADLNERVRGAWELEPFVSLVVAVAILNLATVYFFNVVNKSGGIWRRGDTVHYVLHLDRMVTGLAVFFREILPLPVTRWISWAVLALEALLAPWILLPRGRRVTRPLAMLGNWALHGAFGVMMRLGPFSWFMITWSFLLPVREHWEALGRWYAKKAAPRVVVYDRGSPLAFALARLLVRLDLLERLRFEESAAGVGSESARPELLAVRDPESGRVFTGTEALREIVRVLPGGRFAWPVLRVGSLGAFGALFGYASRRREAVARFFGLGREPRPGPAPREPSPIRRSLARARVGLREVVIAYLGLCAVSQVLNENKAVPPKLKHEQPAFVRATIGYPRMYQGWGMFAPNPITDDGVLAIDAVTIDGRRIDPFTGEAPDLDLSDARGLGLQQIWQDYFNRIRLDRNKVFRQGLREYLNRWHLETGRPEDELVAFDVYWVRDECPKPGQSVPTKNEKIAILTWRKPGYRPPPGQPPLPPEPKVESAGN